jgi:quinol-cytochrome oxidoreductase complex cytochrome b subunit
MRERIAAWFSNVGKEAKQSADPGLLAALRILGLLYGRIDRTIPIDQSLRQSWSRRLPANVNWKHAFGGIAYFLFMILVVSGVLLTFYYRPSVDEAYPSIQFIVSEAPFGWLLRDMHVWAASLIVVALAAHMARILFAGAYKSPRETSWFVGLALFAVVILFGVTGYLLPWDQWAYWATTEFASGIEQIPLFGGMFAMFMRGDRIVSSATLSRFFALHVIVLPWLAFGLISLHFVIIRGHGIAGSELKPDGEGTPFYPNHLMRIIVVSVFLIAVVGTLAALFPRPVGDPATPFYAPDELVSTWVLVDVTVALLHFLGSAGIIVALLLVLAVALVPLFDRKPQTDLRSRPVVAILGVVVFAGFIVAWVVGHQVDATIDAGTIPQELLDERAIPPIPAPTFDVEAGAGAPGEGTTEEVVE